MNAELTVQVSVRTRPLWSRLLRWPLVARRHFVTMRRNGNGVLLSIYASWILAGFTVTIGGRKPVSL